VQRRLSAYNTDIVGLRRAFLAVMISCLSSFSISLLPGQQSLDAVSCDGTGLVCTGSDTIRSVLDQETSPFERLTHQEALPGELFMTPRFAVGEQVIILYGKRQGQKAKIIKSQLADTYTVKAEDGFIRFYSGKGLGREKAAGQQVI
jgi:hypothetical protein